MVEAIFRLAAHIVPRNPHLSRSQATHILTSDLTSSSSPQCLLDITCLLQTSVNGPSHLKRSQLLLQRVQRSPQENLIMLRLAQGFLWFCAHMILVKFFPRSRLLTLSNNDPFWSRSVTKGLLSGDSPYHIIDKNRVCIVCATSSTFRFAYYGFWTLTDAGILSSGITSSRSIEAIAIETALDVNDFWRNWNITTQKWLSRCIYQQLPLSCRGLVGVYITFIVCGLWVSHPNPC
jgi:hypothetical protein